MEACYINTAHPDFLSGHQAIAIVNEQLQAKNQPAQLTDKQHSTATQNSTRQQQLAALQTNTHGPNMDPNSDTGGSFFGSFFSGPKNKKKSSGALMEAVSLVFYLENKIIILISFHLASSNIKGYGRFIRA